MSIIDLNDGLGYVEIYDPSGFNIDEDSRVAAVTKVASVCFQSNTEGKRSLYDKLYRESIGLPSTSFEFVPIVLKMAVHKRLRKLYSKYAKSIDVMHTVKYGRILSYDELYIATNLRALMHDVNEINSGGGNVNINDEMFFNTDEVTKQIIRENFIFFKKKIDIVTARQLMRHRVSWQEMSRRYVSNKKKPIEVYLSEKMRSAPIIEHNGNLISTADAVDICLSLYDKAIEQGIKPQEARRIIPVGMMTEVFSMWDKTQFDIMITLRNSSKAQEEIRELAVAMSDLARVIQ
jgi:thymidylate synthase (FAD)